jgi:hypothetical protein
MFADDRSSYATAPRKEIPRDEPPNEAADPHAGKAADNPRPN